jgi:hypothetical protein
MGLRLRAYTPVQTKCWAASGRKGLIVVWWRRSAKAAHNISTPALSAQATPKAWCNAQTPDQGGTLDAPQAMSTAINKVTRGGGTAVRHELTQVFTRAAEWLEPTY